MLWVVGKSELTEIHTVLYPELSGWVDNKIYAYNNKHFLRRNKDGYGNKTH
jgi:hypothetical protein